MSMHLSVALRMVAIKCKHVINNMFCGTAKCRPVGLLLGLEVQLHD